MRRFFFSFVLFVMVALPMASVEAAFVPCGTSGSNTPCTLCHIVIMGKGIMDWGMQVMVAIGLVVITAMGIMYIVSAGDEGMIKNAKSGIKTSLIGVGVMLGAWLIVNTLLLLVAQETDASKNPIVGLYTTNGYTFSCTNQSASGGAAAGGAAATGVGATCTDPTALKTALSGGGTICSGGSFSCPSRCDTTAWNGMIATAAGSSGISADFIKAIITQESGCKPNTVGTTGDCGLMQVKPASVGNTTCTGPKHNLLDPNTNITQGTNILQNAFSSASSMIGAYGSTTTRQALAAAIYNGGAGQSGKSVDCSTSDGWPVIPKWGCPINPGTAKFNACAIRRYACNMAAC
ncbi:MAG: transglycosylase SLT domain-containing protein [Candidatus Moranbacteria bacterium]|nr:transglycosylase SLT domain-containing protein [Candidatus Moranbacteria bacterium]MBP7696011.1 transglycosylase SLT domain-containing protein [Candidatus Moranbacteria bacterium]